MLEEKYREAGFFIEVRLQLPDFVESNFMPSKGQQIDDTTAANLATQLLGQLEAKIAQIPNDPDKYMSKTKLSEMYDNLKRVYAEKFSTVIHSGEAMFGTRKRNRISSK